MADDEASSGLSYASAGVSIDAGNHLVDLIKPLAKATARSGCDAALGGFGGLFDLKAAGYRDPVLVMGTDGVGTKLKIAQTCGHHDTVGQDLVAMCVNDILAHGAEPLAYLDYFACGKLEVETARQVVAGIAEGCRIAGCALLGGETAEMPSFYASGEYDLAGFAVGAAERDQLISGTDTAQVGDVVIGVASSGVHSNGFSLVRRVVTDRGLSYSDACPFQEGTTLGRALLAPTKIYCKLLLPLIRNGSVKAFAHITGGGLLENIPRVLSKDQAAHLDAAQWDVLPVFRWLATSGGIAPREMARTFNCGLGAVVITSPSRADDVIAAIRSDGGDHAAWRIGHIKSRVENTEQVLIDNIDRLVEPLCTPPSPSAASGTRSTHGKRAAVLISGSGTNLQALIDDLNKPSSQHAHIVLVISNKDGVRGLERAQKAGIPTKVISHKGFKDRSEYDELLHQALVEAQAEIVVLAGFMRILSEQFVSKWKGRMLNIHPSLLPSFRGHTAHEQVLASGVRLSGCTVHFVEAEVDAGGIIVQECVPVLPADTLEALQDRVKAVEHKAYPEALRLLATGLVRLADNGQVVFT
eukprot:scpid63255/ scgid25064/ Trifunctional purine biosynthetic protein adenosine-3; Phosphoribosylamine--glycine ligase; Glycinamide ribonucleotide synthetase; Phosphoribosylglycinamide synthetase; Phosphoribosylformylglycinamidine cyclo-ligase; AIR synthase; Phosphoribosyl-aminoimidazole synthetase; Phosphoribosylglycinamide formyltransferase; 5&apos; GAR transformylase